MRSSIAIGALARRLDPRSPAGVRWAPKPAGKTELVQIKP
jgi:hypothetical protein